MSFLAKFSLRPAVLALAVVFCFALVAQAAQINPPAPGVQTPDVFTSCTGCVLVAQLGPQTVTSSNSNWQATLVTQVWSDPGGAGQSPYGTALQPTLDFLYQLTNVSPCTPCTSGPDNIGRFTAINFSPTQVPGLLVDIGYNTATIGSFQPFPISATIIPGTVDRVMPGDTIGWGYTTNVTPPTGLSPGTTTVIMEVATNALNYSPGHAQALDGGTANFNSFQPNVIPEPGSAMLIGLGMLALASLRRSRRS